MYIKVFIYKYIYIYIIITPPTPPRKTGGGGGEKEATRSLRWGWMGIESGRVSGTRGCWPPWGQSLVDPCVGCGHRLWPVRIHPAAPVVITQWSTTRSSKVDLPYTINLRASCSAKLVTLRSKLRPSETRVLHRAGRGIEACEP